MNNIELKEKRKKLGLTQDMLAKELGVDRRTVINYEKGEVIPESKVKLLDVIFKENVKPEAIPIRHYNEMSVMYVPLVNRYAYGGYQNGHEDPEYIESLPKIPWSDDIEHKGEYLCFEYKGESMFDGTPDSYLDGDILLCRKIRKDFWKSKLHINQWDFVIVHRENGIVVKRIIKHDVEKGILTLHSLNDYFEDYEVDLRDVDQILNVVDVKRNKNRR